MRTTCLGEALMMLKEHIDETYGAIRYTIGTGCSGGSIQQHLIAADYPGLLDGIQPNCSFQDSWTTANEVNDCHLLRHYFSTPASRCAAGCGDGRPRPGVCTAWDLELRARRDSRRGLELQPDRNAGRVARLRPGANPGGVRCDVQDYQSAIWGFRPSDGFARSPFDNVGVQYGLGALNAGTITPEQFVELNENVGGPTSTSTSRRPAPRRISLPVDRLPHGQVTNGAQLANVPIIDLRGSSISSTTSTPTTTRTPCGRGSTRRTAGTATS